MKEFYGNISLTAKVNFAIKAESEEKATNSIFEEIEGIEIVLKDGSKIEIAEIEWGLIESANKGNVQQSYVEDFEIYEDK